MPIVYSKPACVQCDATTRAFDKDNIEYRKIDITQDPEAEAFVKELGYLQAPVVFIDADNHWSGFRPDQIKALAKTL